jgi:hypothetical protein
MKKAAIQETAAIQKETSSSDDKTRRKVHFPGATNSYFTEKMNFISGLDEAIPTYQVMDNEGKVTDPSHDPKVISV